MHDTNARIRQFFAKPTLFDEPYIWFCKTLIHYVVSALLAAGIFLAGTAALMIMVR